MPLPSPNSADQPGSAPFMTVHTAIVLLTAAFIGLVVGCLTYLSGSPVAGAVLSGLSSFGTGIPVLRQLIR
ncbi:hypothetical protein [Kitasatospora sp. NPDC059599]|uniref:hypothetical protein n=1 Tax=Kitasatospora sp. NPDC059599 TaxID=3346880 RepID=UPI00369DD447